LNRKLDQSGARAEIKLSADVGLVSGDRFRAESENVGSFLLRISFRDELENLVFRSGGNPDVFSAYREGFLIDWFICRWNCDIQ